MSEDVEFDLFGNPVEPMRDLRGRPSFAKNKENQQLVVGFLGDFFAPDCI